MAAPRRRAHRAAARPQPAKPRAAPPSPLPALDPRLVEGIALFNQRQFYSSHDTLEQLWLQTEGRPREFYQGLIQAAVACYHWSKGNLPGALSLYQSSRGHLARYRPEFLGVDVEEFLARYTELFGWLRRHRMRYEPRVIPTIHFASRNELTHQAGKPRE